MRVKDVEFHQSTSFMLFPGYRGPKYCKRAHNLRGPRMEMWNLVLFCYHLHDCPFYDSTDWRLSAVCIVC